MIKISAIKMSANQASVIEASAKNSSAEKVSSKRNGGFALIEILVALALLGLIVSMISGAIGDTARLNVAGEIRLAETARVNAIQALLQRQIEGALPLDLPDETGEGVPVFAGGEAGTAFATRRPSPLLQGGLYLARLIYRPATNGKEGGSLFAAWQRLAPARPLAAQTAANETQLLLDQVATARFLYYGSKSGGETGWHTSWQGLEDMPSLISVELEPTPDAGWRWPPLVLAPRISTPIVIGAHP